MGQRAASPVCGRAGRALSRCQEHSSPRAAEAGDRRPGGSRAQLGHVPQAGTGHGHQLPAGHGHQLVDDQRGQVPGVSAQGPIDLTA
jgi:hypothetical protein